MNPQFDSTQIALTFSPRLKASFLVRLRFSVRPMWTFLKRRALKIAKRAIATGERDHDRSRARGGTTYTGRPLRRWYCVQPVAVSTTSRNNMVEFMGELVVTVVSNPPSK